MDEEDSLNAPKVDELDDDVIRLPDDLEVASNESDRSGMSDDEMPPPPRDDSILTLTNHKESVFSLSIDPSGRFMASGGMDHVSFVFELGQSTLSGELKGHDDSVTCLAFNYSGNVLATGDMAGMIIVWCYFSSKWFRLEEALSTEGDLQWLRWFQPTDNADCKTAALLAGDSSGLVTVWPICPQIDQTNQKVTNKADRPAKYLCGNGSSAIDVYSLPGLTPPRLAVLYEDCFLKVWDLQQDSVVRTFELKDAETIVEANRLAHMSMGEDEGDEEAGGGGSGCGVSPVQETKMVRMAVPPLGHSLEGLLAMASNDGRITFASCGQGGSGDRVASSQLSRYLIKDGSHIEGIDYCHSHPYVAFATISGVLGIFDASLMRSRQEWLYQDDGVHNLGPVGLTCLKWSSRMPIFFTATLTNAVIAWPGLMNSQPAPLAVWWGHRDNIMELCLPPAILSPADGEMEHRFVTASDDCTIKVFPIDQSALLAKFNRTNQ